MINRRNWLKANAALFGSFVFSSLEARNAFYYGDDTQPSDNQGVVNLGSNENPYGPSPKAIKAMMEIVAKGNRYAFNAIDELCVAIGKNHNLMGDNILLSSGTMAEMEGFVAAFAKAIG
jgi:histidinol-phosphate aminotransferase